MSAHKAKRLEGSDSGIIIGGAKRKPTVHKKIAALSVLSLVIVLGIAIGGVVLVNRYTKKSTPTATTSAKTPQAPPQTPLQKAEYLADHSDYAGAEQILSDQINSKMSKQDQANIYLQQTAVAMNTQKYADAQKYAASADGLVPSAGSAYLAGFASEQLGDKAKAKVFYQEAISRLDKTAPQYRIMLEDYQSALGRVS